MEIFSVKLDILIKNQTKKKMTKDLVSVIIPTYNREDLIGKTIQSVLNQTYQNFEILIVDDSSTDDTSTVVKSFNEKRIKYIKQEHTGIPAIARNNGLKKAKGNYIAFLDSDDLWLPQKLEKQLQEFANFKEILLVSTNGVTFPQISKIYSLKKKKKIISFFELLKTDYIINSSVLIKKDVIDKIGYLDENKIIKSLEDYDYWLRFLYFKNKSILVLNDILIKYRLHESNISQYTNQQTLKLLRRYIGYKYIFKKLSGAKSKTLEKIFNKKTRFLKNNILKNLYLKKKDKRFLKQYDVKMRVRITILLTNFFQKYIKKYIRIDSRHSVVDFLLSKF